MNANHFHTQMNRLAETYGGQHYKRERVDLLWRELSGFSDAWISRTIDKFIGECRQAPLVAEFREEASRERERTWGREKEQNAQDAKQFFLIADDPHMRGSILTTIVDRMRGNVTDQVWGEFMSGLSKLVGTTEVTAIRGRP